jgi:hypothetical protein
VDGAGNKSERTANIRGEGAEQKTMVLIRMLLDHFV